MTKQENITEQEESLQLNKRLEILNKKFFGTAFETGDSRIEGQLRKYKICEQNFLDKIQADLAAYLKTKGWNVEQGRKEGGSFYSGTDGNMKIQFSSEPNGAYEKRYFISFSCNNKKADLTVQTESDFDKYLLEYFSPDNTNLAKSYKPERMTAAELKDTEKLRRVVNEAERAIEHNESLEDKYNFKASAVTEFVAIDGQERNETVEIKFADGAELVGKIKEICGCID